MSEHQHVPSRAPAPVKKDAQTTPAPKPKQRESVIDEVRRLLKHGTATLAWLRQEIVPALERAAAGERQLDAALDLAAYKGLATIMNVLERTQSAGELRSFIDPKLVVPDELVEERRQLRIAHDLLRARIDVLAKLIHARVTPTPPARMPGDPDGSVMPRKPGPNVSFTTHVAGPPSFDFGKVAPGKSESLSLPLFNLVQGVASVAVRFDGSSAIRLRSAPTSLFPAGTQIRDGAQHVSLEFAAPAARGAHRGTVQIDLSWGGKIKSETLRIPVIAHSAHAHESTDDEIRVDVARRQREQAEDAKRAKQVKQAEDELAAFDRAHPGFKDDRFDRELRNVFFAVERVVRQQDAGIARASEAIFKYRKAPPPAAKPNVLFELAMVALTMASAGVANIIAKGIERGLKGLQGADPAKTIVFGDAAIFGISDAVKEGFKIAGKRALPNNPDDGQPRNVDKNVSNDPRSAFLQHVREEHNKHAYLRSKGVNHGTALLRPTLFKQPELAVRALETIGQALAAEADNALDAYFDATMQRWFSFIAELRLDLNRVGSVDGHAIGPVRGVVDIGFQAGRGPRDPVVAKSAIMRGVSNAAIGRLRKEPLLGLFVPIRLYGVPSPNHAELLVTVTRDSNGTVQYLDQTNGSAPGPGQWLKTRGGGDPLAGANSLLETILGRSLLEQNIVLTTDQDPSVEYP